MSLSLETIRANIRTSIHGRRLGLDQDGYLAGVYDVRKVVTSGTSDTTGTALPNNGIVSVVTTTNDTWTLTDPLPGERSRWLPAQRQQVRIPLPVTMR